MPERAVTLRAVTLAEPHASSDRVSVVLAVASRGERDPDLEVLHLVDTHRDDPGTVAERLAADEDPDRDN